jgi:hypothetical protein
MRLRVQIPRVEPTAHQPWPERCPRCGNATFHSHGFVGKPVRDTRFAQVRPRRIQCTACGHTLRGVPPGDYPPRPERAPGRFEPQLSDGENELTLGIEVLSGEDTASLQAAIAEVARAVGAEVLVSDDADP